MFDEKTVFTTVSNRFLHSKMRPMNSFWGPIPKKKMFDAGADEKPGIFYLYVA
jgi:hypothetical protein